MSNIYAHIYPARSTKSEINHILEISKAGVTGRRRLNNGMRPTPHWVLDLHPVLSSPQRRLVQRLVNLVRVTAVRRRVHTCAIVRIIRIIPREAHASLIATTLIRYR